MSVSACYVVVESHSFKVCDNEKPIVVCTYRDTAQTRLDALIARKEKAEAIASRNVKYATSRWWWKIFTLSAMEYSIKEVELCTE